MSKVGLLVIATQRYMEFIPQLIADTRAHFLPGHEVTIFVHTDKFFLPPPGVVRIQTQHNQWPRMTLDRYIIFVMNKERYSDMDYLFYIDADSRFLGTVGDEILNPLTAVTHFGYDWRAINFHTTLEGNHDSKGFSDPNRGMLYTCGGFQGGERERYLEASREIATMIRADLRRNIMARFHDESYWNTYLTNIPGQSYVELPLSYAYPIPIPELYTKHSKIGFIRKDRKYYQHGEGNENTLDTPLLEK